MLRILTSVFVLVTAIHAPSAFAGGAFKCMKIPTELKGSIETQMMGQQCVAPKTFGTLEEAKTACLPTQEELNCCKKVVMQTFRAVQIVDALKSNQVVVSFTCP